MDPGIRRGDKLKCGVTQIKAQGNQIRAQGER